MKQQSLSKEEINEIFEQQQIDVRQAFIEQLKNDLFFEMLLKIWDALFLGTNPNGKNNTKLFLDSYDRTITENFMANFEDAYQMYANNNNFAITKVKYQDAFLSGMEDVKKMVYNYFELDKKIITSN
jgi:hypothetical protein